MCDDDDVSLYTFFFTPPLLYSRTLLCCLLMITLTRGCSRVASAATHYTTISIEYVFIKQFVWFPLFPFLFYLLSFGCLDMV